MGLKNATTWMILAGLTFGAGCASELPPVLQSPTPEPAACGAQTEAGTAGLLPIPSGNPILYEQAWATSVSCARPVLISAR
jgi:hypothetical protein